MRLLAIGLTLSLLSAPLAGQGFKQINLVSNLPGLAATTDASLTSPWGLARAAEGPWSLLDNGIGYCSFYAGTGKRRSPAPDRATASGPTAIVFNPNSNFLLSPDKPAIAIVVTDDGTISGWNPDLESRKALLKINNSQFAVYKGVTIGALQDSHFLYVTNFRTGQIEVYDKNFHRVTGLGRKFRDEKIPSDFAPYNIQSIGENLVVTFAKRDPSRRDPKLGPGLGFVDIFNTSGKLLVRLEHGTWLNAPWGVALAPGDFGGFSNDLLVGSFGSGEIAAYNPVTGQYVGVLKNPDNSVLTIEGLRAIAFGNSDEAGPYNSLFFSARVQRKEFGLFGELRVSAVEQGAEGGERRERRVGSLNERGHRDRTFVILAAPGSASRARMSSPSWWFSTLRR